MTIPQDGAFTFVHGAEGASQHKAFSGAPYTWAPSDPPTDPHDDGYDNIGNSVADSYVDAELPPNIVVDGDGFARPAGLFSQSRS